VIVVAAAVGHRIFALARHDDDSNNTTRVRAS
jgi:hypothetical protein